MKPHDSLHGRIGSYVFICAVRLQLAHCRYGRSLCLFLGIIKRPALLICRRQSVGRTFGIRILHIRLNRRRDFQISVVQMLSFCISHKNGKFSCSGILSAVIVDIDKTEPLVAGLIYNIPA